VLGVVVPYLFQKNKELNLKIAELKPKNDMSANVLGVIRESKRSQPANRHADSGSLGWIV
jgi:hypothetical protein